MVGTSMYVSKILIWKNLPQDHSATAFHYQIMREKEVTIKWHGIINNIYL